MKDRFMSFAPWARYVILGSLMVIAYFIVTSMVTGLQHAIFGNPEVKREQANTKIAQEQVVAETEIADAAIGQVRERDVYREHIRTVVRESQEQVDEVWDGESVGRDVDAAGSAALCRVHHDLCRPDPSADVQPVR